MLTPEYLATFPDYIVELFEQYDAFVVEDFSRRVAKAGKVTETAEWQAIRASEMGLSMDELTRRSSELMNITQEQLKSMYQEAFDSYIEADEKRFAGSGLNYQRIANNPVLRDYMTAAQEQTRRALQNILWHDGAIKSMTGTTAVMLKIGENYMPISKAYTFALDLAQMQVSTGVLDYNTAIRNAIRSVAKQGVSTRIGDAVGYDSGYHLSVGSAARMCVLTGVNQMAGNMNRMVCDELGLDLVETTAHMGARPSHQTWQGQIFSRSGKSDKYPDLYEATGLGTVSGLMGARCRHNYYGYYEGSPRAYTDRQLYEMTDAGAPHIKYEGREYTYYEATQKQRQLERNIIATKRELIGYNAAGDQDAFTEASIKLRGQKNRYMEFSQKANLLPQTERLQQDGYDRSLAGKATWAVRKASTPQLTNSVGRGIITANKSARHGIPNSIVQVVSKKGGISRDYYDGNGVWVKQITNNNHGFPTKHPYGTKGEHAHDITWVKGKPFRTTRDLTDFERKENADIL